MRKYWIHLVSHASWSHGSAFNRMQSFQYYNQNWLAVKFSYFSTVTQIKNVLILFLFEICIIYFARCVPPIKLNICSIGTLVNLEPIWTDVEHYKTYYVIYYDTLIIFLTINNRGKSSRGVLKKMCYWNHISAWVSSCKFAAYFQNIYSEELLWRVASNLGPCEPSMIELFFGNG